VNKHIDTIIQGDCLEVLRTFPDDCIQTVVTSPPYWGLRDYGVDEQLGLEKTPEIYVEKMLQIFNEIKRILRTDGTLWLNLGDTYASGGNGGGGCYMDQREKAWSASYNHRLKKKGWRPPPAGLKHKDLVGIPWRVAFALQGAGWYLRQDIIWAKTNCMPEAVRDRCTKSHKYIFLMTKKPKYYCDMDSIKERASEFTKPRGKGVNKKSVTPTYWDTEKGGHGKYKRNFIKQNKSFSGAIKGIVPFRNKRSVWKIPTAQCKETHFATFPQDLVKPCVLAGCPKDGIVLDPFSGSGTTAIVAKLLGRHFIGIDISAEYCEIARKRLAKTYYNEELF